MSIEPAEIARLVAKEFADQTNNKVEVYYEQTSQAIREMSISIGNMAKSVQKSNEQLVRYEERQASTADRMERIETTVRELGIHQRESDATCSEKLSKLRDEVKNNSIIRRVVVWLGTVIIVAMIGGGMLFSSITGKVPVNKPVEQGK